MTERAFTRAVEDCGAMLCLIPEDGSVTYEGDLGEDARISDSFERQFENVLTDQGADAQK